MVALTIYFRRLPSDDAKHADHLHIKHVLSYLADTFHPPRPARPSRTYQTVLVGRAPVRGADQGWIITGRRGAGCAARWRGRYVQQQSTAAPVTLSDALRRSAQHDWDVHGSAIRLRKVRDEEAVGSNPATPTNVFGPPTRLAVRSNEPKRRSTAAEVQQLASSLVALRCFHVEPH
jgi:hypothetical protein